MNFKKYMRLKNDSPPNDELSKEERELFETLLPRLEEKKAGNAYANRSFLQWFTPVASVLCAVAVVMVCMFATRKPDEILYKDEYITSREVTVAQMQDDITYFDVNFEVLSELQINLYYDTKSNDDLYYRATAIDVKSSLKIVVVINENYTYNADFKVEMVTEQLTDYTVNYGKESDRSKTYINYQGWIEKGTEILYFDYMQKPAMGDEAFFATVQQIVRVK